MAAFELVVVSVVTYLAGKQQDGKQQYTCWCANIANACGVCLMPTLCSRP